MSRLWTNELRTVQVADGPGRTVEAVVRRHGIDARADGRGFVYQSEEPVTLLVRDRDTLRRISMPERNEGVPAMAFLAAPIAAMVVARMFRPKKPKGPKRRT
jgi:hypothetical protein